MKKSIGTYFSQYFKMPHLYRDDLVAIEKVILQDIKPAKYRIACEGMEFEHVDEISPDIHETNVMVVYTVQPSMRLKFSRSWTELYSAEDTPGTDGPMREIGHIVAHGERLWLWKFCHSSMWLAPLIGFGSFGLVSAWISMGYLAVRSLYLVTLLMILMSVWWGIGFRYKLYTFSTLDLKSSRPRLSWFKRYRYAVFLISAGTLMGVVLSLLLAAYLRAH